MTATRPRLGMPAASIAVGDFDNADSIAAALRGVDSAYLVTPSSSSAEAQQMRFAELGHIGKIYTITGPAAITHAEMARAIGAAIKREVGFVDVPPGAFADALRGFGVPPWQVEGLVEDYAHYSRGEASQVHSTVLDLTGVEPRDARTFARDHAEAFSPRAP